MDEPIISVVMPVFNGGIHLAKAVDSIISQTFTNFEFIIINDGSTDDTLEILTNYRKSEPRIKILSRENKGLIETLNEGINLAVGKYIARMDSDDISLPFRFERQVEFLDSHEDYVAIGVRADLIDVDDQSLCSFGNWTTHDEIDSEHIKGVGGPIVHPSSMIRRETLMLINGYSNEYPHAEDLDLFLRLAEHGKLANIPEILFQYRQHMDSIGYSKRLSQIESARKSVQAACIRRGIKYEQDNIHERDAVIPTKDEIFTKWGWWALNGKNIKTAKKYAVKSLYHNPLNKHAWKLLACTLRGH